MYLHLKKVQVYSNVIIDLIFRGIQITFQKQLAIYFDQSAIVAIVQYMAAIP